MAIDPRLGQVTRVTALRRDKAEREMAQSASVHQAREEALETARKAEMRQLEMLAAARETFRANPGCAQAQLWQQIAKERREEARGEVAERASMRDLSEEDLARARAQFQRANERHRLSEDAVRVAKIQHRRALEEKEADEMQGATRPMGNGLLK